MSILPGQLQLSDEVAAALSEGRPVLALESTLITHGMPWPANLKTARRVESVVRGAGAAPATIALLAGRARVGLDEGQLEALARGNEQPAKCSRRDLAALLARGACAGTTVAASLVIARLCGIEVFATGGIGGVHRGAARSLDVSADLQELARTPMTVVCSGPKAILDIGLTREHLETHGVPVIGYRTDQLPAFYSRDSGHPVDFREDSPEAVANIVALQRALGLDQAVLVVNPVPEAFAMDADRVEAAIDRALGDAESRGMRGAELTPFLLERIEQLSGGDSLAANRALIESNARLGAEIAVALRSGA